MRIGIYASMRNEEANLDAWLACTEDADLVVLNDTGSSDHSMKMAQRRALRDARLSVSQLPVEPMQLSNALNIALAQLPEDVDLAIRLDLDERLQPGWRDAIEAAWAARTTDLPLLAPVWFDHGGDPYLHTRVHSRHGFRWTEPVHEVLVTLDGRSAHVNGDVDYLERIVADTTIEHHQDFTKDRSQVLGELQAAHDADPMNPRWLHYLGREYTYRADWNHAIPLLRAHTESFDFPEQRAESWILLGDAYRALMPAEDVPPRPYREATTVAPSRREGWVRLAELCMEQGHWSECLDAAEAALSITERDWYLNHSWAWGALPHHLAAIAAWELGRPEEAAYYGAQAAELEPTNALYRSNLSWYRGAAAA